MKIKINKKISRNLIKEKITKTKIASQACRERLAGQLYDKEDSLGRRLNPDERRNIINNFRFDITNQCTWYHFEPLITQNKSFKDEYEVLMSNIGKTGDETEALKVKASLDKLIGIVKKFKRFTAYPGPVEPGYMSDMLELLKGITKKYEDDYLRNYNFNIKEPDDIKPSDTDKVDDAEGVPLVQKQKRLKETTKRNNKSIILRIPKK